MSRFQAKTNAVLDVDLDTLREQLGLRSNQKADLLRELTTLAAWVVRQAAAGRAVVAQGPNEVQAFNHPLLERIRHRTTQTEALSTRIELSDAETRQLAELLDQPFTVPPGLRAALQRLADPNRCAPDLTWSNAPA